MEIDAARLHWKDAYKLLIGTVVPRPIALVTTLGPEGPNAAPFSFFNVVGANPPMVAFSPGDQDGREKDTVRNIRSLPEFVVHVVTEDIGEQMNVCAVDFPPGVNEIEAAGLTALPSVKVRPPRIAESPVQMECRLVDMLRLGNNPYHLTIGEVLYFHVRDDLISERLHVDVPAMRPIGRLAGSSWYCRVTDRFEIRRTSYREWQAGGRGAGGEGRKG